MSRVALAVVLLVSLTLLPAARAHADTPDLSLFSRTWSVHRGTLVMAGDGDATFSYSPLGVFSSYTATFQFTGVSDDGRTAYGTVVGTDDPGLFAGGIYSWYLNGTVFFSAVSDHTAYLQESGTIVFLCSDGWLSEVPQPPCGA